MGDIKSAQIALDPDLSSHLGDTGRRDLLYQVKQDASRFTHPQDELVTAMISLARRTEANMAAVPKPALPALEADNPDSIRKPISPSWRRRKPRNPTCTS